MGPTSFSLRQRRSATALAVALACSVEARAQVSLQLSVDPPQPAAGVPFRLTYGLTFQGGPSVRVMPLDIPNGVETLGRAEPPQAPAGMMMGGGGGMFVMRSSSTYLLRAPRPGRYVVRGARAIDADGHTVAQVGPYTIVVTREGSAPQQAPDPDFNNPFPPGLFDPMEPQAPPEPQIPTGPDVPPEGNLTGAQAQSTGFLRAVVDVERPYVGQQVVFRAFVYVPNSEAGCEPLREATLDGFWSEVLMEPQQQCARRWIPQRVGPWNMWAGMVRRLAVFPTHAGRMEIGPLRMGVEYIESDGGFFGRRRRAELATPSLVVEAREPPTEGRPAGYVPGTIGPLTLTATLDRAQVPVGETATLTIRAQGNGYLGSVTLPSPRAVDGLRVLTGSSRSQLDRNVEPLRSEVINEFRLVADRPGAFTLAPLVVPWFDPATGRYDTTRVELPVLTATGTAQATHDADEAADDPSIALEGLQRDVPLTSTSSFFTTPLRVWGTLSLVPGAVLLAGFNEALRRWSKTRRTAQAETAKNDPRSLLSQADAALASGDAAGALGLGSRALDRAERGAKALDESLTKRARSAREACDGLRFAGASADREAVAEALREVRAVIEAMEAGA